MSSFFERGKKQIKSYLKDHSAEMFNPIELAIFSADRPTYISYLACKNGRITKEELLKYAEEREKKLAKEPDMKGYTKDQWKKLKELHLV